MYLESLLLEGSQMPLVNEYKKPISPMRTFASDRMTSRDRLISKLDTDDSRPPCLGGPSFLISLNEYEQGPSSHAYPHKRSSRNDGPL